MASLGSTPGLIVAAGVGAAASAALNPAFEVPKQEAWARNAQRLIGLGTVAELVARGGVILGNANGKTEGTAYAEALRQGYAGSRLDRLVWLAQRMPDYGTLRALANRQKITGDQLADALNRHAFPADWHKPLTDLFSEILSPGELAAAIHRGLVPSVGLLKGEQPKPPFNVEAYPVYDIDPLVEALGSGFDHDRLGVLVGLQGLPMGPHEAAQALFRHIITHGDYIRAFNESNSRNEWAQAVLDQSRQIPTARDFLENALRGYRSLNEALAGAELHGMSEEHATMIYQNQGRPMNIRQITMALARGAKFHPEPGELKDPYRASIVEGPIKPAYYEMAESLKYTLPSVFTMRALAQAGTWSEAKTAERLKWSGWFPQDADEAAKAWAASGTSGATADPHIAKAQTQLWTATHSSYLNRESSATVARTKLAQAGVAANAIATVLGIWDHERELIRKGLSAANVKKAFNKGGRNNATGQPWTRDEALAWLVANGWSLNEANDFLDIP